MLLPPCALGSKTMKIFNWVHRKFNRPNELSSALVKDELCGDQTMVVKFGGDTQAFLGHEALVEVLGGWKDGLLAIGTLGFDEPMNSFHFTCNEKEKDYDYVEEKDYYVVEEKEDGYEEAVTDDAEGEQCPLVLKAIEDCLEEEITDLNGKNFVEVFDYEKLEKRNGGERITLADLFYSDYDGGVKRISDANPNENPPKSKLFAVDVGKKQSTNKKYGNPFTKLIPRVGEDSSRPIKKINQLMTKMLKRKIHPELEGNAPKSEGQINKNACGLGANEKLSLLQTQDIVL